MSESVEVKSLENIEDIEDIKKLINLVLTEIPHSLVGISIHYKPRVVIEIKDAIRRTQKIIPNHSEYLDYIINKLNETTIYYSYDDVRDDISHILDYIQLEEESNKKLKELKIFETAYDKIESASECFRKEELSSVFHNLNTSLELMLKDKLDIPATMRGINTANIIEILVKYSRGPHRHLNEARKRVLDLDNKIKHQGYSPSKREAIDAIKIMEELWAKLKDVNLETSAEIQEKIFSGI